MSNTRISSKEIYAAMGERIRAERQKRRLSQEKLASYIGLTRTSVTNIEKGRQKIFLHTVFDIATALGTSPAQLLSPIKQSFSPDVSEHSPEIQQWILGSIAAVSNVSPVTY